MIPEVPTSGHDQAERTLGQDVPSVPASGHRGRQAHEGIDATLPAKDPGHGYLSGVPDRDGA